MATLINGNLNSPIYASQDADLLAAICGNQTVIAPVGNQFAHELEDANTIKVNDGVIITKEGRRIQLDAGDIDEFIIPTGTQGQTHYFLCGYHLYTDEESAELCETFVEPADSSSETIDEDTFREGNTEVYVTLFRVTQVGVNITDVEELLAAGTDIKGLQASVSQLNNDLTDNGETFKFGYDSQTDKMGYYRKVAGADTFFPFKDIATIGTYSDNTTIDISTYGATDISQFLIVPKGVVSNSNSGYVGNVPTTTRIEYVDGSLSLSGNNLTITLPQIKNTLSGNATHVFNTKLICDLYYIS